jgi:signal transduction histidine kinase/4-amino-4-deoxy-L-arabinose transferase-like glycosyltransferase
MRSVANGAIDLNPHAFSYPSLGIYLHLLVQQGVYTVGRLAGAWTNAADYQLAAFLDPSRTVLAARAVGVLCDALSVLAAWRIGRRISPQVGVLSALVIACSASMITTSRSIYVDSIMTCLALFAVERMLVWHGTGRRGAYVSAAVLVGLAASAKYPAAVLLLPLVSLVLGARGPGGRTPRAARHGDRRRRLLVTTAVRAAGPGGVPARLLVRGPPCRPGPPGERGACEPLVPLGEPRAGSGWPACIGLVGSLALLGRRDAQRPMALALWLALSGFALPIAFAHIDAERYLLPVVALAAPLTALGLANALERVPARARAASTAVAMAGVMLMPIVAGVSAARRGARDTQVDARRWCESHVGPTQLVVSEGYGPRLVDQRRVDDLRSRPAYLHASRAWQARVDSLRSFHVVCLPLVVTGRLENTLQLPGRPPVNLEVAPHASTVNSVYYEPSLFTGADWFVTTSAVRGRLTAEPARFPAACRLYQLLDRNAEVAARFVPAPGASGPEVVIYRLDEHARAAFVAERPWDPLWWTGIVPEDYRRHATALAAPAGQQEEHSSATSGAEPPLGADGQPAPWVRGLLPLYLKHVATFDYALAEALALVGRYDDAARVAGANHLMMPADVPSCLIAAIALARTQRWSEARATIERTLRATDPAQADPALQLQYARSLAHTGDRARGRELDRLLVSRLPAGDPLAAAACRPTSNGKARSGPGAGRLGAPWLDRALSFGQVKPGQVLAENSRGALPWNLRSHFPPCPAHSPTSPCSRRCSSARRTWTRSSAHCSSPPCTGLRRRAARVARALGRAPRLARRLARARARRHVGDARPRDRARAPAHPARPRTPERVRAWVASAESLDGALARAWSSGEVASGPGASSPRRPGLRSRASASCRCAGGARPYGVLVLRLEGEAGEAPLASLAAAADAALGAQVRAAEARRRARHLSALAEFARAAVSASNVAEGVHALVRLAAQAVGVAHAAVYRPRENGALALELSHGPSAAREPQARALLASAAEARRAERTLSGIGAERLPGAAGEGLGELSAWVFVPITAYGVNTGVLAAWDGAERHAASPEWERGDLETLAALADHAALLFEHARRLDELTSAERRREDLASRLREQDRLAAVGEMAARVAEDARQPLASVAAFVTRVLRELEPEDPRREYLEVVRREAERVDALLNEQLAYAKLERPRLRMEALNAVVQEALRGAAESLSRRRVRLVKKFAPDLPELLLDAERIRRVVTNIISCALEAIPSGGRMRVETRRAGAFVVLDVVHDRVRQAATRSSSCSRRSARCRSRARHWAWAWRSRSCASTAARSA